MSLIYNNSFKYAKTLIKWVFFACLIGALGGIVGSLFHHSIDFVTELRKHHPQILFFLPLGGIIVAIMYGFFKNKGNLDTNRVIASAKGKKDIPFVMLPLIFTGATITHLVGGSAGREGAALQLGGSLGYKIGKIFKFRNDDINILVMAGISAVFSALFGTPAAAAIFAVEVAYVSTRSLAALVPCFISSFFGYFISLLFGISPVRFEILNFSVYTLEGLGKSFIISAICAFASILFCFAIHKTEHIARIMVKNIYIRGLCGGIIILILTFLAGSYDYNGAGMNIVAKAISGTAKYEAFILKIIFTAITVAAGFKGGEIVPAFFVGSTLGCVLSEIIGIDPGLGAAIGFIVLFCGITKCLFASFLLAMEVFGTEWCMLFIFVCLVGYLLSGKTGIYEDKKSLIKIYTKKGTHN